MEPGERIAALETVKTWPETDGERFVVMGTRRGIVKRTDLRAFRHPRVGGIIAMGVDEGDAVVGAELTDGHGEIFLGTSAGKAIRFGGDRRAVDGAHGARRARRGAPRRGTRVGGDDRPAAQRHAP